MPLSDIATINVTTTGAGITRAGYGVPNIVSYTATWAERSRRYTSLTAVAADFAANTPEYLAAAKIFGQRPKVSSIRISRGALKPTQYYTLGCVTPASLTHYKARIAVATGTVFPSQDADYITAGATGWRPSQVWSKGDLVIASDGVGLWSCKGPSQIAYEGGMTGYGAASGPTGVAGDFREGQIYWMYAGSGITGAVTNDAVMNGLKARLEALGSPTAVATGVANAVTTAFTGSEGSRQLRVTANTAGKFFAMQVYSRQSLSIAQDYADPGIATDLAAIKLENNNWYGLITLFNSEALIEAAAAWVETNTKLYAAASCDSAIATAADSTATDVAHDIKASAYARTFVAHHPSPDQFMDAAEMGKFFVISPGGETWRMKALTGVTAETYSDTETDNMTDKHAHWYYEIASNSPVVGGEAKTGAGEFVDVTRFIDWYTSELQADLADMAIQNDKIPFTNDGIGLIQAKVEKRNQAGIKAGGIASDPAPIVTVPDISEVSASDKAARELSGVETEWTLAGAIHHITVNVTASA